MQFSLLFMILQCSTFILTNILRYIYGDAKYIFVNLLLKKITSIRLKTQHFKQLQSF
jgi:hypothetical protein